MKMGEKFRTIWGNDLEFPGDPNAPAKEVINCHCVMVPDVATEAERESLQSNGGNGIIKAEIATVLPETLHAKERMNERRVSSASINDALTRPMRIFGIKTDSKGRRSQKYIGEEATVVKNPDDDSIVTVWATGKRDRKKYAKKGD